MKFTTLLFVLLLPISAFAYGPYNAVVTKNIDGDSMDVRIFTFPQDSKDIEIRVSGVNSAESHPKFGCSKKSGKAKAQCEALAACEKVAARRAAAFTAKLFPVGSHVIVDNLHPEDTKYYGRMNADITKDGVRWSTVLLSSGNARPYTGGKRQPWCQGATP